jgi:nicotinate phosphoribosyltransferase
MRLAAGENKILLEFGLRRAQGPDGGISASKYCYIGGFNGTSNVLAGKLFGLDVRGTHAHAYVMAHVDIKQLFTRNISTKDGKIVDFVELVFQKKDFLNFNSTNLGELAAFIEYAQAFPEGFLALVDTYDTLQSGVPNFILVALALDEIGYQPRGIRLDSGDLAYLSRETRAMFIKVDHKVGKNVLTKLTIVASNDINEEVLGSLNREGHSIDTFGIGTHLVTCYQQPALGCVYKLVEINQMPRIKLSQEVEKLVIPGRKSVYRLFGKDGLSILDLIQLSTEDPPEPGVGVMCRHPFQENKRALVTPTRVQPLLTLLWDEGKQVRPTRTLDEARDYCANQIRSMRNDHIRGLNPTPYKVSVSQTLYEFLHQLWSVEAPIAQLE